MRDGLAAFPEWQVPLPGGHRASQNDVFALLRALDRDGPYVVAGRNPDRPLAVSTLEKAWYRVCESAGLTDARLHDFRHTVGTYGGQAGYNAFLVRDLLGDRMLVMTGRYVERDADPVRIAMEAVSGRIADALDGNEPAEVKPFPRGRKGS